MLIGVGVVLIRPDGSVLLGRRTYPSEPESWCLPGGKAEAGERFEDAARRETAEECGLDLIMPPPFAMVLDSRAGAPRLTAAFAVDVPGDVVPVVTEPHKLAEWRWFATAALPSPLFDATAAILAARSRSAAPGVAVYRLAAPR